MAQLVRPAPQPGEIWQHFKGGFYLVDGIYLSTDDESPYVAYHEVSTGKCWVRPLSEFLSLVDKEKYPDVKAEYRFVKWGADN